jgi:hypothetical protein
MIKTFGTDFVKTVTEIGDVISRTVVHEACHEALEVKVKRGWTPVKSKG